MRQEKTLIVALTGMLVICAPPLGCSVLVPFDRDLIGETGGGGEGGAGASSTGGGSSSSTGDSSSSTGDSSSSTGGTSSTGTAGGTGGSVGPVCGDGQLDAGEECDDGNVADGDGCSQCKVDCGCPGCAAGTLCTGCGQDPTDLFYKDPASKHCYLYGGTVKPWIDARAACIAWGGDLAGFSAAPELTAIVASGVVTPFAMGDMNARCWTGANDQAIEGVFEWVNGEPWQAAPAGPSWAAGEPGGAYTGDCGVIAADNTMRDRDCLDTLHYLCEQFP